MNAIKVSKAQVKPIVAATFPSYRGRTFKVEFAETVCFHDTNWGGGSRSTYKAVRMSDGQVAPFPNFSPWSNPIEGRRVELPEDVVVVEHAIFCGQDMGLRFYAHPSRNKALTS